MKLLLTALTIIGFLGIAVFGVFGMSHGGTHSLNGCIAALVQGADCSIYQKAFSFLTFHLEVFKSFSTAVFGERLINALFILTASLSAIGLLVFTSSKKEALATVHSSFNGHPPGFVALSLTRQFTRWLAIHENSPSFS